MARPQPQETPSRTHPGVAGKVLCFDKSCPSSATFRCGDYLRQSGWTWFRQQEALHRAEGSFPNTEILWANGSSPCLRISLSFWQPAWFWICPASLCCLIKPYNVSPIGCIWLNQDWDFALSERWFLIISWWLVGVQSLVPNSAVCPSITCYKRPLLCEKHLGFAYCSVARLP